MRNLAAGCDLGYRDPHGASMSDRGIIFQTRTLTRPDGSTYCTVYIVDQAQRAGRHQAQAQYSSAGRPPILRDEPGLGTLQGAASFAPPPDLHYPATATWSGGLLAPQYATYRRRLSAPAGATLAIDGRPVLTTTAGAPDSMALVVLARGLHQARLAQCLLVHLALRVEALEHGDVERHDLGRERHAEAALRQAALHRGLAALEVLLVDVALRPRLLALLAARRRLAEARPDAAADAAALGVRALGGLELGEDVHDLLPLLFGGTVDLLHVQDLARITVDVARSPVPARRRFSASPTDMLPRTAAVWRPRTALALTSICTSAWRAKATSALSPAASSSSSLTGPSVT